MVSRKAEGAQNGASCRRYKAHGTPNAQIMLGEPSLRRMTCGTNCTRLTGARGICQKGARAFEKMDRSFSGTLSRWSSLSAGPIMRVTHDGTYTTRRGSARPLGASRQSGLGGGIGSGAAPRGMYGFHAGM